MIYNDFNGIKLSALGMGNMRLPVVDGNDSQIDVDAAREMIDYCMESGVNYYDTAYGYHGGQSELVVGELLKKYDRDKFYLASKFPGYDLSNMPKVKEIFEDQLKKCQVEYFDFSLLQWLLPLWILTSNLNAALTVIVVKKYVHRQYIFRMN